MINSCRNTRHCRSWRNPAYYCRNRTNSLEGFSATLTSDLYCSLCNVCAKCVQDRHASALTKTSSGTTTTSDNPKNYLWKKFYCTFHPYVYVINLSTAGERYALTGEADLCGRHIGTTEGFCEILSLTSYVKQAPTTTRLCLGFFKYFKKPPTIILTCK